MAKRNDSSQMRAAMQTDRPEEVNGQGVKREVPVGSLVAVDNADEVKEGAMPCRSEQPTRQRESEKERERGEAKEERGSCCYLHQLKRVPQCHVKLEPLTFRRTHTVLIDVNTFRDQRVLKAQQGSDLWNKDYVKMPCSPKNLITKPGLLRMSSSPASRWDVVCKQLEGLAKKTTASVDDVEKAIKKYNPKYEDRWSFVALQSFVKSIPKEENDCCALFPKIAKLALRLPSYLKKAIPLLQKGQTQSITLSQGQIACLLANAFYCTFPHRNASNPQAEYHYYPTINFNSLFGKWSQTKKEKLRAIFHYFRCVSEDGTRPSGLVTFERRSVSNMPNWRSCKDTLSKLHVTSEGCIEVEGTGMLQVDFACNMIGGGVLGSGLVQEEILFLMNPELIVSRLFTEKLADNECLFITGSQQFSLYSGYRDSFEWAGSYEDNIPRDEWRRRHRQILAIDALHFRHPKEQYTMIHITRELNKAYCGFKADGQGNPKLLPDIATGNWGCGAFNGDSKLKALIQLMAAAVAQRGMAFFTFRDSRLERELQQMYHLLTTRETTVGKLYEVLEDYCAVRQTSETHVDVFEFLKNTFGEHRSYL